MTKDILLNIRDSHLSGGEKESYEIVTRGKFRGNNDNYKVKYDEQFDEFQGCHTTLEVTDGKSVAIIRRGECGAELFVEENKRHNCQYNSPYGTFMMGIYGTQVLSEINNGKGRLLLKYTVDIYGDVASENEIEFILK